LLREFVMTTTPTTPPPHHNPFVKHTLTTLSVDTNELGDDGTAELAAGAAMCHNLHSLNLECNEIELDGATALIDNPCPRLTKLLLDENMDLPVAAVRKLKKMYQTVAVDGDIEAKVAANEEEEEDEEVDELAEAVSATHIG